MEAMDGCHLHRRVWLVLVATVTWITWHVHPTHTEACRILHAHPPRSRGCWYAQSHGISHRSLAFSAGRPAAGACCLVWRGVRARPGQADGSEKSRPVLACFGLTRQFHRGFHLYGSLTHAHQPWMTNRSYTYRCF
jgi:hypothetical protein